MRILITGGGTGGHVNPALAVAEAVKKRDPEAEIAFVGTPRGIENKLVPAAGFKLFKVNVIGFRRSLSPRNIKAAWLAMISPLKASAIIRKFKPDVVFGTGGYVSWPIMVAAARKKVPTAVHEANAVPGLAVRKLIPYTDKIYLNFKISEKSLGPGAEGKTQHVGCPLRSGIGELSRKAARERLGIEKDSFFILSFGGSLGAARLNEAAMELSGGYICRHPDVTYVHATGDSYYGEYREKFLAAGYDAYRNVKFEKYINDMDLMLAAADLVICRSGAITLAELSRAGRASILIPSPNVTDNQQYKNARVFADCGGAILIEEKDLTEEKLESAIESVRRDPSLQRNMEQSARSISPDGAETVICDGLFELAAGGKN